MEGTSTPPPRPTKTPRWSRSIKKVWSTSIDLGCACLEFVPEIGEDTEADHFVVGTYNLLKKDPGGIEADPANELSTSPTPTTTQTRNGSLSLWKISGDEAVMEDMVTHPAGVFDLKFYSNTKNFATAGSNGTISMYRVQDHESSRAQNLIHITTVELFSPDIMVLHLAWKVKIDSHGAFPLIAVTTCAPDCGVYVFFVSEDFVTLTQGPELSISVGSSTIAEVEPVKRHTDNVWTVHFSSDLTLYSGADDCTFKRTILEHSPETGTYIEQELLMPAEFPGHQAGVTSIMVLPFPTGPHGDHLVLTGSYDDHIRIWSTTSLSSTRAQKQAELFLGGCAWRLRMMEDYPVQRIDEPATFRILASNMQAGFKILEIQGRWGGDWSIRELAEAVEAKVLNYASDVQPMKRSPGDAKRVIVSSSFYEKTLSLWSWDPKVPLED